MTTLSIKSVPEDLAETLRQRAARNHRSLQGELMAILEAAVAESPSPTPRAVVAPATSASRPFGEAAVAFRSRFATPLGGSLESTALIREMRDRRAGSEGAA
jgi:plasmid stability protein